MVRRGLDYKCNFCHWVLVAIRRVRENGLIQRRWKCRDCGVTLSAAEATR